MLRVINVWRRRIVGYFRLLRLKTMNCEFSAGKGFFCGRGCFVSRKNRIVVGRQFYMGNYCHLAADAEIGDDVIFASFVSLVGGDHRIDNISVPMRHAGRDQLKMLIVQNDVWIGHGAVLMHGVTISSGSVIAAGAVVTKDVPPRAIVGGNPASVIRFRR